MNKILIVWLLTAVPAFCFAQKEIVDKHITAGIEKKTLNHYGSLKRCKELIAAQFKEVDRRINEPGVFDFVIRSVIDTVFIYEGDAVNQLYVKTKRPFDIRILYEGFPTDGGGWYGAPYYTIAHKWAVGREGGPFAAQASDGIAHEYGHTMRMYDLYALEVKAENNPVNGLGYRPVNSIMTYPYNNCVWDELSVCIINRNRYGERSGSERMTDYFPQEIGIRVTGPDGKPVRNAAIACYPGEWYQYKISPRAMLTGTTGVTGSYRFASNPFAKGKEIGYPIFLVEVTAGGKKSYDWLPVSDVQLFWVKNPGKKYYKTIQLM